MEVGACVKKTVCAMTQPLLGAYKIAYSLVYCSTLHDFFFDARDNEVHICIYIHTIHI